MALVSPLLSLLTALLMAAVIAANGALRYLQSVGSALTSLLLALSRLIANRPAAAALTMVVFRPLAPDLKLPFLYGLRIHWLNAPKANPVSSTKRVFANDFVAVVGQVEEAEAVGLVGALVTASEPVRIRSLEPPQAVSEIASSGMTSNFRNIFISPEIR